MRFLATTILLMLSLAPVHAQCVNPETAPANCTLFQTYEFYRDPQKGAAALAAEKTGDQVRNANRATEPPAPFAAQLHNSYQDFLNLLSFAVNKVEESEDGQALTVRFNPVRSGSDVFGGTVTAARPGVSDLVRNALPETGRTDLVAQMERQLGQTDDLTFSASWARQTVSCGLNRDPRARCWGRDPATYRAILSHALAPLLASIDDVDTSRIKERIVDLVPPAALRAAGDDAFAVKLMDARDPQEALAALRELAAVQIEEEMTNKDVFSAMRLADVAILVDNQPQLTSSVNYHDAGRYGGPPVLSASFELQFGNANINGIRSRCGNDESCLQNEIKNRLQAGISTMKWVVTGSYAMNDDYELTDLGPGVDVPEGFKPIQQRSFNTITVKAQGGAQMPGEMMGQRMRADGSVEFERVTSGDPERRKNRFVAKATVTVPFGENMSIPLSVTWANQEKYLGDQTDKFGMHLGISYRLPELFGKK